MMVFLVGCSQTQYLSHLTKKAIPPAKSQGTFKVGNPYKIAGKRYVPQESYEHEETGIASWYGPNFHGKQTANGEIFDMYELTAAHRTLQMPSLVRVTNLENGRSLIVRINDRGPFARGRVIDLSKRSAELLGFKNQGTAKVRVQVLTQESLKVAEMAKQGRDTSGVEVALNRGQSLPQMQRPATVQTASAQTIRPEPVPQYASIEPAASNVSRPVQIVEREAMMTAPTQSGVVRATPGHIVRGNFYPDPIVTEMPVSKSDIFIQVGSFSSQNNAVALSQRLSSMGQSQVSAATVNGRQFYRVRLGPAKNIAEADQILNRVIASGNQNAMIIVE
jgi:rare lipoprotein A